MIYICPKCGEENSQGHECKGESGENKDAVQLPCAQCIAWKVAYEQLQAQYQQLVARQQPFTITTSTTGGVYSNGTSPWIYMTLPSNGSGT